MQILDKEAAALSCFYEMLLTSFTIDLNLLQKYDLWCILYSLNTKKEYVWKNDLNAYEFFWIDYLKWKCDK